MALDDVISIEREGYEAIQLTRVEQTSRLSGVSKKGIYVDLADKKYFVKEPKVRKTQELFKNDPTLTHLVSDIQELSGQADVEADSSFIKESGATQSLLPLINRCNKVKKYTIHKEEVILINMALEVLASRISAAVMGPLLIAPQNYLYIHEGMPLILSPSVGKLCEFLSESPQLSQADNPRYWQTHPTPTFAMLVTNIEEAKILGQAYYVALLLGHYDLVNNINLTNFGCVENEHGKNTLSIVDWGNALGAGFNGQTAEEGAFKNTQFDAKSPRFFKLDYKADDVTNFQHMMPFDQMVYPLLPRQVVVDLFDLTANDKPELREAQRQGFYEACEQGLNSLDKIQYIIPQVVQHTFQEAMPASTARTLKELLPHSITHFSEDKNIYNLVHIIEGRIRSLQLMKAALLAGKKMQDIAMERLNSIMESQIYAQANPMP